MLQQMTTFESQTVVVTGAASGIGRAMVGVFAKLSANVVAMDIAPLDALAADLPDHSVALHQVDIGDERAVKSAFAQLERIDVLCANAGRLGPMRGPLDYSAQEFADVLSTNVVGTYACVRAAVPAMVERGSGAVVCTASVAGLRAGAGPVPYSASKAAVINLVQTLAFQLSGTGVRINGICPGLVETGMTRGLFEAARAAGKEHKVGQLNPLRRPGKVEEIANVAAFLASEAASYVQGQVVAVDGGLSASHPFAPGKHW